MIIQQRCTICHSDIEDGETVVCGTCERPVHEECVDFEQTFECRECADEPDVGAVEF
jgi:hypothetical protein